MKENKTKIFSAVKPVLLTSGICLFLLMLMIFCSIQTGLGLEIISGTFYRQGVSLLEGQIILPIMILFPVFLIFAVVKKNVSLSENYVHRLKHIIPVMISLIIWISAAMIWINTPFEGRSYFLPALRPPNYNFYPSSDAENYDLLAQSILVGNGFRNGMTVVRPLYVAFLAFLHALAGNDYLSVTNLQIIVLAAFPVFIYLIGRQIHHPVSGILASVWIIWRESESIRITPLIQISNSRLLMSDLPTALVVSMIIFASILWYQKSEKKVIPGLITGGLCGIGMLIRTQSFILVPAVIVFYLAGKLIEKQFTRYSFRQVLFVLIGVIIVFSPWQIWNKIYPNDSINGESSETNYLYRLYETTVYSGEDAFSIDQTSQAEIEKDSLFKLIIRNPGKIFSAVSAHFINNELSTLFVLPVRDQTAIEPEAWIHDTSLFWYRESSRSILSEKGLLVICYGFIICFGIGCAFQRSQWAGLIPLWIHLAYNAGTSAAMNSGFRFLLPVDWAGFFYFAIGIVGLFTTIIGLVYRESWNHFMADKTDMNRTKNDKRTYWKELIVIFQLLCIGMILPLCERMIPYKYHDKKITGDELIHLIEPLPESQPVFEGIPLTEWINEEKITALEGRAIYPRFYPAGEGDSGGSSSIKQQADYDRLVWMIVDRNIWTVSLPMSRENSDIPIRDPMDVIVIGKVEDGYIDAWWIIGNADGKIMYWESSFLRERIKAEQ